MRALVIGDATRAEMQSIGEWLRQRIASDDIEYSATISARNGPARHPDLIVVLESHPDEHSLADVQALFAFAPTSRIVCCAGAWSESAGRTRKIWPLAVRVPATAAIARLEREFELLQPGSIAVTSGPLTLALPPAAGGRGPSQGGYLPATGSREEWFAAHHPAVTETAAAGTIRIISPDAAYRAMLIELLGQSSVADDDLASVDAIIWDADPWHADRIAELQLLIAAASVIAVSGWITPELVAELRSAGVKAVVPKFGDVSRVFSAISASGR